MDKKKKEDRNHHDSSTTISSGANLDLVTSRICQVIVPVTLCSLYVVVIVRILENNIYIKSFGFLNKMWSKLGMTSNESSGQPGTTATGLLNNLLLVAAILLLVVLITLIILLVFYLRWHKCMEYYFRLPALLIMAVLTPAIFRIVCYTFNSFSLDFITFLLLVWNFTALGMMAIFGCYASAPLSVQQFYLINNSSILALVLITSLPSGALYLLLLLLIIWDLFAVLTPVGPLQMIIKLAEREGVVDMPGLVYTTHAKRSDKHLEEISRTDDCPTDRQLDGNSVQALKDLSISEHKAEQSNGLRYVQRQAAMAVAKADAVRATSDSLRTHLGSLIPSDETDEQPDSRERSIEEHGVNIGLGDFIFYSILVGMNSRGRSHKDYYATLATFDAVLVGLVVTLVFLSASRQAVPALPVSIGLGLAIAPLTRIFAAPMSNLLAASQVFI